MYAIRSYYEGCTSDRIGYLEGFEALEKIRNAMNGNAKLQAEVLAANSRGSEVEGRLRIESRDAATREQRQ